MESDGFQAACSERKLWWGWVNRQSELRGEQSTCVCSLFPWGKGYFSERLLEHQAPGLSCTLPQAFPATRVRVGDVPTCSLSTVPKNYLQASTATASLTSYNRSIASKAFSSNKHKRNPNLRVFWFDWFWSLPMDGRVGETSEDIVCICLFS